MVSPKKEIKSPIAYDPRSGFKVPLGDMVEDGEYPGLFVHRDEADELNLQRFPANFFPEGILPRTFPPNERDLVTMRVGLIYAADPEFAFIEPISATTGPYAAGSVTAHEEEVTP